MFYSSGGVGDYVPSPLFLEAECMKKRRDFPKSLWHTVIGHPVSDLPEADFCMPVPGGLPLYAFVVFIRNVPVFTDYSSVSSMIFVSGVAFFLIELTPFFTPA